MMMSALRGHVRCDNGGVNLLHPLRLTNGHVVLRNAARIIRTRGLARGVALDKKTGAVDVWGAICLACNVKEADISDHVDQAAEYVPSAFVGVATACYEVLSRAVDDDISHWADTLDDESRLIDLLLTMASHVELALDELH